MAKILICGGNGQLGADCRQVLQAGHEVVSTDLDTLDITDSAAVARAVGELAPDVLINCAAFTRVDDCETREETARQINGNAPGILARAMQRIGGRLIHVSTDYVFDGRKPLPGVYTESDDPCPLSVYGRTKLDGEIAVQRETGRYAIVRTAWLYGTGGPNFLKTMLRMSMLQPDRTLRVVNDQFGSPTWSFRLARQIERLMDAGGSGIYHATGEGHCTWYELARYFLDRMDVAHRLDPCTTEQYPTAATRPMNAVLENRRLKAEGIHVMRDWRQDVAQWVSETGRHLIDAVAKQGGKP